MTPRERFDALDERDKAKILDKHRHWNTEVDWWDSAYDRFKEDMDAKGIHVTNIYFSGFSSQGDGACFEGAVYDWPVFLKALGYDNHVLIDFAKDTWSFNVKHRGHYYHENCTSFHMEFPLPEDYEEWDFLQVYGCGEELRDAALITALSVHSGNALEAQFTDAFKDHMRDLYRRLEEEHEYLTSDEVVLETLDANDMLDELIEEAMESEDD